MGATERTFIMIKPDGVARNLVAKIIEIRTTWLQTCGYEVHASWHRSVEPTLCRFEFETILPFLGETHCLRTSCTNGMGRNIIHGSDSVESALKEIGLWFKVEELVDWNHPLHAATYEMFFVQKSLSSQTFLACITILYK